MKNSLLLILALSGMASLSAQTVEEGNRMLYYQRYESAGKIFRQLSEQSPQNGAAWNGLVKSYVMQDKASEALAAIRQAPSSGDPAYSVAYGTALLHAGLKDSAALFFNRALDATKEKDAGILAAVAEAHVEAKGGDATYAVELMQKAVKRDKRNPQWSVLLGDAYRKLHNGSEAYKSYREALEKDEKYAEAYHRIADIFASQNNTELFLENYNKAVEADARYAPSLYRLYVHAFYNDPAKAKQYYQRYAANSDPSVQNRYDLADLFFLNKEYREAIDAANALVTSEGEKVKPRLFKLLGYSYAAQKDTARAIISMERYFAKEADSNLLAMDYASMAGFLMSSPGSDSVAMTYLGKAAGLEKDKGARYAYYKKLADFSSRREDFSSQARWLEKYYEGNDKATNLDLFYWGLAYFKAKDYAGADSVFGKYVAQYPEQSFGYYWQAKSQSLLDREMESGLAIPTYQKLITVLEKDTANTNYKKWMVESYAYLAAYEANTKKNYEEAVDYFEKVLEVDPENESAKKYIAILEKSAESQDKK